MINLILITSVINTQNTSLSYSSIRSAYNPEERFEQTKKTIHSLRNKIPNSNIFIVECSELKEEYVNYLTEHSDYFLNLYDNEDVRSCVNSLSKSLGEGTMTINALDYIINKNIHFDNFFKISGRYWLSNCFKYENYENSKIVIRYFGNESATTILYKLPKGYEIVFNNFLKNNIENMKQCIGYEQLFWHFLKDINSDHIINTPIQGIEGYISMGGFYDDNV
jgi:hypothetical protein